MADKDKRRRRRRDLARMKDRARQIYPHDQDGKLANHIKNCSCYGCRNQRQSEGPTFQERNAKDDLESYETDW